MKQEGDDKNLYRPINIKLNWLLLWWLMGQQIIEWSKWESEKVRKSKNMSDIDSKKVFLFLNVLEQCFKSNRSSLILIHKLHCFPTNLALFLLKRFWAVTVDQPPFPPRLFVLVVRKRLVHSDALTHQITACIQFYKTDINTWRTWLQNILIW